MGTELHDIYLDKVYLISDSSGKVIRYLPIDSEIVDSYLSNIKHKGFNVLKDNHKSLTSFFKFLEHNYNFVNPMLT